jgi:glycosyltransferase involved in cell wall biosynthesis
MSKKNLIFIYPKLYTFIQTEIKLLSDEFNLISINQNWERKILLPFNLIRQVIFLVINIRKVDTILISFGGYWSFFPALFSNLLAKKVAIVMHGTDCVSFPEIEYGNLRNPILSFVTKKSLQWASIILPVSESLVYTENNYYSSKTLKFGYNYHLSNIKTPYKVIHNGLNILDWVRDNEIIRNKTSFVTVLGEGKIKIKGVDLIIEVASRFPNSIFYLAGIENVKGYDMPKNIICKGRLTPEELKVLFNQSQFYLQLSNTEGFGVALCEAMLCECIPLVSDVNFLPTIVGDSGFVLKKRNSDMLVDLINMALNSDIIHLEQKARKRIKDNFSVNKRKKMLLSVLTN